MKYSQINPSLFINNRKLFSAKIEENSIAIFNANDIMPTNSDGTMPFKQNSDLFWLTSVDQEESVLAVVKNNNQVKEMLFLKETNEHIAIWEGAKLDKSPLFPITVFFKITLEPITQFLPIITSCSTIVLGPKTVFLPILTFLPTKTLFPNFTLFILMREADLRDASG